MLLVVSRFPTPTSIWGCTSDSDYKRSRWLPHFLGALDSRDKWWGLELSTLIELPWGLVFASGCGLKTCSNCYRPLTLRVH